MIESQGAALVAKESADTEATGGSSGVSAQDTVVPNETEELGIEGAGTEGIGIKGLGTEGIGTDSIGTEKVKAEGIKTKETGNDELDTGGIETMAVGAEEDIFFRIFFGFKIEAASPNRFEALSDLCFFKCLEEVADTTSLQS